MPTYNAWHGGFGMFFSPHKILTAKNKIDAPKKNQCTTCWLLNGFISHKMFNLHKREDYTSEENTWQKMVPCVFFFSLTCKPHVFHWDPMFSTRPYVFHYTPCFPPDSMFSTPHILSHPVFSTPWGPVQGPAFSTYPFQKTSGINRILS